MIKNKKIFVEQKISNALLYYLSIIGFFAIFSTTISKSPVLPLFMQALGSSDAVIGLISAISPLAGILFSFPVGLLSDKIGHKKLLIIAGVIFLVSPLLYLLISNPWYLIPIRFFHGLATAILGPVASKMIFEKYKSQRGEKIGWYSSATLIGRTIAPIVGGSVLTFFALRSGLFSYHMVYVFAFIASFPIIILIFMLKDEKSQRQNKKSIKLSDFFTSLKTFVSDKKLFATALVEMATYFSYGVLETYLPIFLSQKGVPAYQIGLIFSIQILSLALSKPLFGKLSDRIDRRIQIIFGILLTGVCIFLVPLFSTFVELLVIGIFFGLGMSFSTVATGAYVADIAKKEELGASVGALSSIMDVGQSMGPLITGLVITYFSFTTNNFLFGFAISFLLCLIVSAWFFVSCFRKSASSV